MAAFGWESGIALLEAGGLVAAAFIAALTYRDTVRQKRSEWVFRLFEKFYDEDRYRPMRRLLDFEPDAELSALKRDVEAGAASDRVEGLVDYLNFFELMALQVRNGQISEAEVVDVFDYYLRGLKAHGFIAAFIAREGYTNLSHLLKIIHAAEAH